MTLPPPPPRMRRQKTMEAQNDISPAVLARKRLELEKEIFREQMSNDILQEFKRTMTEPNRPTFQQSSPQLLKKLKSICSLDKEITEQLKEIKTLYEDEIDHNNDFLPPKHSWRQIKRGVTAMFQKHNTSRPTTRTPIRIGRKI